LWYRTCGGGVDVIPRDTVLAVGVDEDGRERPGRDLRVFVPVEGERVRSWW
jgi:hypothetical protein